MHCSSGKAALVLGIILILFSVPLFAQTAEKLESILNSAELNWSDTVIFVLEASDKAVFTDPEEAYSYAAQQKWLPQWMPRKAASAGSVKLKDISLLLMRAFDQKGGIFYSIFKNSHYAYRELIQKEIIRGDTDPAMKVSGQELLLMIGRILSMQEQNEQQAAEE